MANYVIGGIIEHYYSYQIEADNEIEAIKKLNELYPDARDMHIKYIQLEEENITEVPNVISFTHKGKDDLYDYSAE